MRGLLLVARREISERGRSKAYIGTTLITMLLIAAAVIVPQLLEGGPQEHEVGVVGPGGMEIVNAAERLGNADRETDEPAVLVNATTFDTREEALAALESGSVDAVLVGDSQLIVRSISVMGTGVTGLLQQGAAALALERTLEEHGEAAAVVIQTLTSNPLQITTSSGADPEEGGSRYLVAYFGLLLLYLAILLYGTWILTGVTEEKSSRVVEVLLSALRPWQLLGGKVLGIGALGMTQFVLTIAVALIAISYTDFELPALDPLIVANLIMWFVIGFLIYAVLFGAAGSMASRAEEAQNVAFPMSMIAVVGMFVSFAALDDPNSTLSVVATFIPVTAPFVVPVRVAMAGIPLWQFVGSVAVCLLAIAVLVRVAGRVYRGALLRYGGRIKLREAWRGARE